MSPASSSLLVPYVLISTKLLNTEFPLGPLICFYYHTIGQFKIQLLYNLCFHCWQEDQLLNHTIFERIYWLYLGESFLLLHRDEIIKFYLLFSTFPSTQTYLLVTHNTITETKAFPFTAVQQFCVVRETGRVGDDKRWYTLWDIHKMYLIMDKHTYNQPDTVQPLL